MPRARGSRTDTPRFRPTLWPDQLLKAPAVERGEDVKIDEAGWITYGWAPPRPLPDELVLGELGDVDPTDSESVLGFVRDYGIITEPADARLRHGLDPKVARPKSKQLHINELSLYAGYARTLAWHWLAVVDGERVMGAWERAGVAHADRRMKDEIEDDVAWSWFTDTLNAGLRGLPPHIMSWARLPLSGETIEYGEPTVDLFTGLCVQLFNVMVEGLPIRTCANEPCGRRFVRQLEGRAEHGQHRTEGLRFCSRACAKAQSERERRRRRRKESK